MGVIYRDGKVGLHVKVVAVGGEQSCLPQSGLCPPEKTTNNYGMRRKSVGAQVGEERRRVFF